MKTMKKAVALIVSAIMLMCMVPAVFAAETVEIYGASVTLENNLTLNIKAEKAQFGTEKDIDLVVNHNGVETVVEDYKTETVDSVEVYVFSYENITPAQINDDISFKIVTPSGESAEATYNIADYCYNVLEAYPEKNELTTLVVDLLNYAADAQIYANHNTGALANAALTETQKTWATNGTPALESCLGTADAPVNAEVVWGGAGLNLQSGVTLRFKAKVKDVKDFYVCLTDVNGNIVDQGLATSFISAGGDYYYVYFDKLGATDMRKELKLCVYDNVFDKNAVSSVVTYSIESYVYNKVNDASTDVNLKNVLVSMMKYGDSAVNYAN